MPPLSRAAIVAVALACGLVTSAPSTSAATDVCSALPTAVSQVVNPSTSANLITAWESEAAAAKASYGFTTDLGKPFNASTVAATGLAPIRRLYHSGRSDFAWAAAGSAEQTALTASGYADQGTYFFASPAASGTCAAVLSLTKAGYHRYAMSGTESVLVAAGWTLEGPAFYARNNAAAAQAPAPAPAPVDPAADTEFAFAVMPDTQDEAYGTFGSDQRMPKRVSYLVANRTTLDLRWVLHGGDVVSWDTADHYQFVNMSGYLKPLGDAAIPYSMTAGNHDTAVVCPGGSACPGVNANTALRDTTTWNNYFPASRFGLQATYDGKSENGYRTYSAGGVKWLVLSLELWPRTDVIAWAQRVVAAYPSHNVIVQTHAFLDANGALSTSNGGYGSNSPATLWNALKGYPNVVMFFSGHVGTQATTTLTATDGHKVMAFLQCFHDPTYNPVRLVRVDTAQGTISTEIRANWNRTTRADVTYVYPASTTISGMRWMR